MLGCSGRSQEGKVNTKELCQEGRLSLLPCPGGRVCYFRRTVNNHYYFKNGEAAVCSNAL